MLVAHQPATDARGAPYYDAREVQANAVQLIGKPVLWAPISPSSRANLLAAQLEIELLDRDWINMIRVEEWSVDRSKPVADRPVIGRHSRPHPMKWPASREDMLRVYPDDPSIGVRMLGTEETVDALMQGAIPDNWACLPFGSMGSADFLKTIDFFVYWHHPDWVEGFGRTIAEAMASGCVVILPEDFRPTFGEAALYRTPEEVRATVEEMWADREAMEAQGRIGRRWIDRNYGEARYLERIETLIGGPACKSAAPLQVAPERCSFDVIHLADFRTIRETAWRLMNEVRIEHEAGLAVGLLHVPTGRTKDLDHVNPELDALADLGVAEVILQTRPRLETKLLVIH